MTDDTATTTDHVELDLPLHARHASTVRAVAASLAADANLSVDDIDDLRLGVNEAVSVLTDVDVGHDPAPRLRLRFDVAPDSITMTARREGVGGVLAADAIDDLARRILNAVVDEFRIADGAFVVVKRSAS